MTNRFPIRQRLTAWFVLALVVTGAVLLALNYALVGRHLGPTVERQATTAVTVSPPATGETDPTEVVPREQARQLADEVRSSALRELVVQSVTALALVTVPSAAIGWIVAGRALRPLQRITVTARRLSEETLHQRLAMAGPQDEIKDLADTFDAMLVRLDTAFDAQRRFIANASHELRTPLTVARTATDVLAGKAAPRPGQVRATLDTVRDALVWSDQLITGLLLMARSQQDLRVVERVDLAGLAREVIVRSRAEATDRRVVVGAALGPCAVDGDRALLERLIGNLVENAVRYNVPGGRVSVRTTTAGGRAVVTVGNTGPVVAAEDVPSLLQPFRRGRQDRTAGAADGAGLGLSIAQSIAQVHDGDVAICPLPDGGLRARIDLPGAAGTAASAGRRVRAPRDPGGGGISP
jgi:signal transduction histidine kinase